jgi:50S ribosomal protein L16 3-hydroxylase
MQFASFDTDVFLRDYWQHKPLLIRNPWTQWHNPLEPDDLAGLACEENVESRLIEQSNLAGLAGLTAASGPFSESRLMQLGARPWTLLVQAADHYVPDVAALLAPFRFIPGWRIDDIMVSLAADGGGVGPHFDQYDVFLIQGLGRRRWQVGAKCDAGTALVPHDDLRLLADFTAENEWVLDLGDILYLPPGIAHNGIAVGDDCMTYSVGFRAPSRAELIGHFCDDLLDELTDDERYGDAGLMPQRNPGEIRSNELAALHDMIERSMGDRQVFARWFGKYNSTPKYPEIDWSPDIPASAGVIVAAIARGRPLQRNPASRFSFIRGDNGDVMLFVDGECFDCTAELAAFAMLLCADGELVITPSPPPSDASIALIAALVNQGSAAFAEDDA